jgi:hypothetical protein
MPTSEDFLYQQLLSERTALQAQLKDLNEQLSKAKFGHRMGIKSSIRNVEQQLARNSRDLATYQRIDVRDTKAENDGILAAQGIDARAARFDAVGSSVSSGLSSIASTVATVYGGKYGKFGMGKAEQIAAEKGTVTQSSKNNQNLIYLGAAAVVIVLIMLMKKK